MLKYSHLIAVVAVVAAAQLASADMSDSMFDNYTYVQFTVGSNVSITLDGTQTSGNYQLFSPSLSGDGVNIDPNNDQFTDLNGNPRDAYSEAGAESYTLNDGTATQSNGSVYYIDFKNSGRTSQSVSVDMEVDEYLTASGQNALTSGYGGYAYTDTTGSYTGYYTNTLDQAGNLTTISSGFSGGLIGPNEYLGQGTLSYTLAAGQTLAVEFWSAGSTFAQSTPAVAPEPPVLWIGLAGLGVLLLRRKSA